MKLRNRLQELQDRIDQADEKADRLARPLPDPTHMSDREMLDVLGMTYQHEVINAIAQRNGLPDGLCWAELCQIVSPVEETSLYYPEWWNRFG